MYQVYHSICVSVFPFPTSHRKRHNRSEPFLPSVDSITFSRERTDGREWRSTRQTGSQPNTVQPVGRGRLCRSISRNCRGANLWCVDGCMQYISLCMNGRLESRSESRSRNRGVESLRMENSSNISQFTLIHTAPDAIYLCSTSISQASHILGTQNSQPHATSISLIVPSINVTQYREELSITTQYTCDQKIERLVQL